MIIKHFKPLEKDLFLCQQHKSLPSNQFAKKEKNSQFYKNLKVLKPWGEEYLLFENKDVAIWILKLAAHQSTSFHAHLRKTTSLIVLAGQANCQTFAASYDLAELQAIILGKKVFHQTRNLLENDLFLMEIESPVNKTDLFRHQDNYGRQGLAYEAKECFIPSAGTFMQMGERVVADTLITINFAKTLKEFIKHVSDIHHAIITILDRHIWSNEGEKMIEVGNSFILSDFQQEFTINDHFHYVIIQKNK